MNKRGKEIIILLILIILLAPNLNAEFTPTTEETAKTVCQGTTSVFTAFVEGSGNININKEGTASSFTTIVPSGLVLNLNKKPVFLYVTPSSKVQPGAYNLDLKINDGSLEKILPLNVNVKDCTTFEISGKTEKEVCGCESQQFEFEIKNTGIYQETYALSIKGEAKDFVELNKNEINLNPNKSTKIIATVKAPCNSLGIKGFSLNVESKTSNSVASIDSSIKINNCFDYNAIASTELVEICEHTKEEIKITIENTADKSNSYSLKIIGPAWANLEKKEIIVNPKDSEAVNLVLTPDYKTKGSFDIELRLEDVNGKIRKDKVIKANIKKCHDASLSIISPIETVCQSIPREVPVFIKNTGEFDKTFGLDSDTEWASVSEKRLIIDASDEKETALKLSPNEEIKPGKYPVTLKLSSLDESNIIKEDTIEVDVITVNDCYQPSITTENTIEVATDNTATSALTITNNGKEKADYELSVTGTASSFVQLNPSIITIDPKKSEVVQLYIAPTTRIEKGDYTVKLTIKEKGSDILEEKDITISVKEESKIKKVEIEDSNNKITGKLSGLFGPREESKKLKEFKQETIVRESTEFQLKGEVHNLSIEEIKENSVTLKISSDPVIVVLFLNDAKEVDIDNNGVADLRLTLDSIENGVPIIKVIEINAQAIEEASGPGFFSKYRTWIIGAIVVIILIVLASVFLSEDEEEKEVKEGTEEEKIKVGRYVLAVIAIGVIAWLLSRYGLLASVDLYKYYIIIGLLVLLILVVIIKYWEEISSFFEEEYEEEKKEEALQEKKEKAIKKEEKDLVKKETKEVKEKKVVKK
ncbi:hypothetical protein HY500_02390 [Candidatus Woesearchaeota archaeon]|nr:hypothetical protein [Candidatus Woesearchaeota archaeon]